MEKPEKIKARIQEEVPLQEIEDILSSRLGRTGSERRILEEVLGYDERILTGGGKRVRIVIPYLMARGLDLDFDDLEIIEALIPIEVYHGASLIMDDVIDQDGMRRGMTTPHVKFQEYGLSKKQAESVAVLDAVELQSIAVIAPHKMEFLKENQRIAISNILQESISDVTRSQILDVSAENMSEKEFKQKLEKPGESIEYEQFYLDLIEGKTVSLFEAGVEILEILSDQELEHLSKYANHIGKAFQIKDDILDVTGGHGKIDSNQRVQSGKIGKDRYSDLMEGSMTLPILYGLEMAGEKPLDEYEMEIEGYPASMTGKEFLQNVLEEDRPEGRTLAAAAKILEKCGALDKAQARAETHAEKAAKHIENSSLGGENLDLLQNIAFYVATRTE